MEKQIRLRKLYELFFEATRTNDLPNLEELKKSSNKFYEFMEQVQKTPEILGEDDSLLNANLADYLQEYAFAAFGVGFALGKSIESETSVFANHLKTAVPID